MSKKLVIENCYDCPYHYKNHVVACTVSKDPRWRTDEERLTHCTLTDDTLDPWDLILHYEPTVDKYILVVMTDYGWCINAVSGIKRKTPYAVAMGQNQINPSRDGETRVLKNGEWVLE